MRCNVGRKDQIIRGVIGGLIVALGIFTHSWLGLLGLVPWFTAWMGWCPIYALFGISSCDGTQHPDAPAHS